MKIYIINLFFLAIFAFNQKLNAQGWQVNSSLPSTTRNSAGAFSIGDIGYVVGGESGGGLLSDFWSYNSIDDSWTMLQSFPGTPREKPVSFQINGIGYYGLGTDSTFFKYDPTIDQWTQITSPGFNLNYWSAIYFTFEDEAYFLFASTETFVKYNTSNDTWTQLSDFPGPKRFTGGGFSADGKGYITCGVSSFSFPYLNDLWEYEISSDNWQQKNSLPAAGRYAILSLSNDGYGYVLGGEKKSPNSVTLSEFWMYKTTNDSWVQLPDLPVGPRNYLSGFVINNRIYAGFGGFGYHNDFFSYDITCNNSDIPAVTPSINYLLSGSTATFNASFPVSNSSYKWESDFGQGFVTLKNYGAYSGVNTSVLNIENVQLSEHNQPIRAIVTTGNCIDTSNLALIKIIDTCIISIYDTVLTSVTDTLVINTLVSNIGTPSTINTIKVYPNPTSTHITIDYGNYSLMSGYTVVILNSSGQNVFSNPINQNTSYIDLSSWTGPGVYFLNIIDPLNNTIETRKIVIN
jgi:N-acetylneuraminic acid mutarotase